MMRWPAILAPLAALLACTAQARTLYVSTTGSHNTNAPAFSTWATAATNIQAAINAADEGDTVMVGAGEYTGTGSEVVNVYKRVHVRSAARSVLDVGSTRISGEGARGCVVISADGAEVSGFVIEHGYAPGGAGVYMTASGLVRMCVMRYGESTTDSINFGGGGAMLTGGTLQSCTIYNNVAKRGGGVHTGLASASKIVGCVIVGNYASVAVGGIYSRSCFLANSVVESNTDPVGDQQYAALGAQTASVLSWVGSTSGTVLDYGGNTWGSSAASLGTTLGYVGSIGSGTNLVFAGIGAYMARVGTAGALARSGYYPGQVLDRDVMLGPVVTPIAAAAAADCGTNELHGAVFGEIYSEYRSSRRGFLFNGVAGNVDIGTNAVLNASEYTLEAWINTAAVSPNNDVGHRVLTIYRNTTFGAKIALLMRANAPRLIWVKASPVAVDGISASVANDGQWHHVAGTTDGTTFRLYVDGVLAASKSSNLSADFIGVAVGSNGSGTAGVFDGVISEARVWARALDQADIGGEVTGDEPGLLGAWALNDRLPSGTAGPFNLHNPLYHPTYMEAF